MRKILVVSVLMTVTILAWTVQAADKEKGKVESTEGVTIIKPGPGGEVTVVSKEVTTTEDKKAPEPRQPAQKSDSARKARVVVVPALYTTDLRRRFERELKEKFGISDPFQWENSAYTTYFVDALVNTRKLDVLEREELGAAVKELDFGESDYADVAKVVKLGQMLNADYVIIPEIRYLSVAMEDKEIPYVGQKQKLVKGKFATSIRTVDVATSKIVASNISDVENKTRFKDSKGPELRQLYDFINDTYRISALKEAAGIVDTAYPIKVIALNDALCTINRGKGAVEVGEVLSVYKTGELMIDPDTKESLGLHETQIGKIKITEVGDKTAKAEILDGKGQIEKLSICRREKKTELLPVQAPAPKLD